MKKKLLVAIALVICLVFTFSMPVSAANGPPKKVTYDNEFILNENIMGMQVIVWGSGTITNHVVKTPAASEESWFKISSFTGYIEIDIPYFIGSGYIPFITQYPAPGLSDVEVHFHMGNGAGQQPLITLRSSSAFSVPEPFASYFGISGTYKMIQMVGGKIIYAK